MSEASDAIVLEGVEKEFRLRGQTDPVRALRGIDLRVERGARVAIMGRSGSGKTTLLQILGALDTPTRGRASVAGRDLSSLNERDLTEYRARTVGFVFQTFQLIPILSARENVELAMEAVGVPPAERRSRAEQLLASVGMASRSRHRPGRMSSGEQQRVAIARALANDPAVILADEPTGSLDSETGDEVITLMFDLARRRGSTVILVTHSDEVARRCDSVHRIRDGKLMAAEAGRVDGHAEGRPPAMASGGEPTRSGGGVVAGEREVGAPTAGQPRT